MAKRGMEGLALGLLLRQAHATASHTLAAELEPVGLLPRHFGVLLQLARDGVSTQRELIAQTGSDKAGMVRTIERLEALGYVTRTTSPSDRRVAHIRLTDAGMAMWQDVRARALATSGRLFEGFTPDELVTLEALLARFVAANPPDR